MKNPLTETMRMEIKSMFKKMFFNLSKNPRILNKKKVIFFTVEHNSENDSCNLHIV